MHTILLTSDIIKIEKTQHDIKEDDNPTHRKNNVDEFENELHVHRWKMRLRVTAGLATDTQCGFRGNRSTVDMIFCLRQLQEKCIEQDRPLYMVFIDFSRAFDTVGRTGLWQLLRKYGCPEKFTTNIEALHTGMIANVSVGGEVSEPFSVTNGVKQGCVLAPTLFSIFLSANARRGFPRHGGRRLHTVQTER